MLIIGIAGGTGCGKTTVVNQILNELPEGEVGVITQGSYYTDTTHLTYDDRIKINFDHPRSIDFELLVSHLEELKKNNPIHQPVYSFVKHNRTGDTILTHSRKVMIVEGILILQNAQLRNLMDIKIFVDADNDDRLMRVIQRDLIERGRSVNKVLERYEKNLAFPQGVVDFFKGMIGQPYGGFPEKLQKIILKGEEPLTCRPGELLEPVDFVLKKDELEKKLGHKVREEDVLSAVLYPGVFEEYDRFRQEYSDTSFLPTPVFFYGLDVGDEVTVDIEAGKTLIVKLNAIGRVREDGTRNIYFELNGEPRSATVKDDSVEADESAHVKADPDNAKEIGAPMPGKIFKQQVSAGDAVKEGDVLLVTEAMKMETNIKAKKSGVIKEMIFGEGDQIDQGDLLVVLE